MLLRRKEEGFIMIPVIRTILLVIYAIVCFALIILATIQTKDHSGASGTITGSSTNNFYEQNKGRTREGKLKRYTMICGIVFATLAIIISILFVM